MQLSERWKCFAQTRVFKITASVCAVLCAVLLALFVHCYNRYSSIIDQRLNGHLFENTAKIYDGSGRLLTQLAGESRAKRHLLAFEDIPKTLIDAVTAGEDQKFFVHHGVDLKRIVGASLWNVRGKRRLQGASTITQQLARSFFLTRERTLTRKISEAFIAILLELRLNKKQIFTMYANEVYLGEHGLYAIHGFGEAVESLFGKSLRNLTLAETATLAGIIPAPNSFSPVHHAERALTRRDLILQAMRESGSISREDYQEAKQAQLQLVQSATDTETSYFVDFTREELLRDYSEEQIMYGGYNVYTTLDLNLQKAAIDSIANGLRLVDKELASRDKKEKRPEQNSKSRPQAALIALDPRTGAIKAVVGGSDYNASQFNRITQAFRQPGSVFKPFVYAAALETAYDVRRSKDVLSEAAASSGDIDLPSIRDRLITPVTKILDAPRVFTYAGEL